MRTSNATQTWENNLIKVWSKNASGYIKERNAYYNHKRYHSAIEYITPWAKYSGQAKQIIESRKQKLEKAKQQRFRTNSKRLKEQTISMPKAA